MAAKTNCGHGLVHKTAGFCLCCGKPATASEKRALRATN